MRPFRGDVPASRARLVLYGTPQALHPDDDYPWAPTWEARVAVARELEETWGENVDLSTMWPSADRADAAWFRRGRASLSPAGRATSSS